MTQNQSKEGSDDDSSPHPKHPFSPFGSTKIPIGTRLFDYKHLLSPVALPFLGSFSLARSNASSVRAFSTSKSGSSLFKAVFQCAALPERGDLLRSDDNRGSSSWIPGLFGRTNPNAESPVIAQLDGIPGMESVPIASRNRTIISRTSALPILGNCLASL